MSGLNSSIVALENALFCLYISSIKKSLVFYSTLVVLNAGFILNIGTILVFARKKFNKNPTAIYNVLIAFTGNICILILYFSFFPQAYGSSLSDYSDSSCKCISYVSRVFPQMISWLHVMLALNRMVSVLSPAMHLRVKKAKFILISAIGVFICLLALNVENLWFSITLQWNVSKNLSLVQECTSDFISNAVRDMIDILMRTLLPILLMVVANIVLIVSLFKQKQHLNLNRPLTKEIDFSMTVLAKNMLFIVFMTPQAVSVIYKYYIDYNMIKQMPNTSPRFVVLISLANTCCNVLATYTVCSTFPANLVFNKLFRQEIRLIMRRNMSRKSLSVPPNTNENANH